MLFSKRFGLRWRAESIFWNPVHKADEDEIEFWAMRHDYYILYITKKGWLIRTRIECASKMIKLTNN